MSPCRMPASLEQLKLVPGVSGSSVTSGVGSEVGSGVGTGAMPRSPMRGGPSGAGGDNEKLQRLLLKDTRYGIPIEIKTRQRLPLD